MLGGERRGRTNTIVDLCASIRGITTAQSAVSALPPPPPPLPPPLPPPPRRPAPADFGFQINGSFFFPRLDSTRPDSTLTYTQFASSSPLRPPSCTFETSIFRSRQPPPAASSSTPPPSTARRNASCTSALRDFQCALQPVRGSTVRFRGGSYLFFSPSQLLWTDEKPIVHCELIYRLADVTGPRASRVY